MLSQEEISTIKKCKPAVMLPGETKSIGMLVLPDGCLQEQRAPWSCGSGLSRNLKSATTKASAHMKPAVGAEGSQTQSLCLDWGQHRGRSPSTCPPGGEGSFRTVASFPMRLSVEDPEGQGPWSRRSWRTKGVGECTDWVVAEILHVR